MDKVQKIREEVERLKSQLLRGACSSQIAMETMCKEEAYNEVLAILDTMQEEPKQCMYSKDNYTEEDRKVLCEGCEEKCKFNQVKESAILQHKEKSCKENGNSLTQETVSEDLGEYINKLSKQFPEVSFAKLSRIAVRVAKWQKQQFEKERLKHCDGLTDEQAQIESDFVTQHLKDNNRTPTFIDAIEYGMKMQKEQMMTKSIEAVVSQVPCSNEIILYNPSSVDKYYLPQEMNKLGLNKGDKVKLVIIKEG